MEDEDFRTIELNGSHLKVFRDGRIHSFDKRCRKWNIRKSSLDNYGYCYLHIGKKFVKVHSVITLCYLGDRPEGFETDHINNNPLDNRLQNLQYLTRLDNLRKRLMMKGKPIKGYLKEGNKYKATIAHLGTKIHLGMFEKEEDARRAYVDAKFKYHNVIFN
jgi:hypothetical protein